MAGEDVAGAGGVYGYYNGILEEFGPERVFDTPISEEGIVGLGVGAAATGCRPIIDLMFMDFLGECMDEVANQLAKMRYMFGGQATLPVTMLTMAGAGMSLAAQHSQSLEAWICHLPGSQGRDAHHAVRRQGADHRRRTGRQPGDRRAEQDVAGDPGRGARGVVRHAAGRGQHRARRANYTIVALGRMMHEALKAARQLSELGVDAEVIDPRTLQPFDTATVVHRSRRRTAPWSCTRRCASAVWAARSPRRSKKRRSTTWTRPVARVGAPFSPVPFSPALEKHYVPNADRIVAEVKKQLGL